MLAKSRYAACFLRASVFVIAAVDATSLPADCLTAVERDLLVEIDPLLLSLLEQLVNDGELDRRRGWKRRGVEMTDALGAGQIDDGVADHAVDA